MGRLWLKTPVWVKLRAAGGILVASYHGAIFCLTSSIGYARLRGCGAMGWVHNIPKRRHVQKARKVTSKAGISRGISNIHLCAPPTITKNGDLQGGLDGRQKVTIEGGFPCG